MAVTSGFFNSINGDRRYDARQISRYLGSLISSGVLPDPSTNLQVMEGDGMAVQVSPGKAFLDCYWMENDSMYTVILDDADMVLDRIDAVIMRLDENDDARSIDITVKKGMPSSTPQAPGMERGDKVKEYCLAAVTVRKMKEDGTQAITQADITDTRADTDVCGWVTGLIDQVDTHTLFLQWQDAYQRFYAESSAEFDAWMEEMESQLGDSVVGALMTAIENLADSKADTTTVSALRDALEEVAFTGRYADLSGKPDLFSGRYDDLSGKPDLFSGDYNDLSNRPTASDLGITSIQTEVTLSSDWMGAEAPYTQIVSVNGVTSGSIVDIDVAGSVTAEQLDAYISARIIDGGQSEGSITLKAFGEKPAVTIPLKVVVRRV